MRVIGDAGHRGWSLRLGQSVGWRTRWTGLVVGLALLLGACTTSNDSGRQISWQEGTPPSKSLTEKTIVASLPTSTVASADAAITLVPTAQPTTLPSPNPAAAASSGTSLTAAQRLKAQPDELGVIPILMYHVITPMPPTTDDGYTRTVANFQADLQKLYELGYYVVPLKDIVADRIRAPLGKHPVALTFDDGTAGQFRYLIAADGSVTIDPTSAVGVMEAFYAAHPDFGRGGYFAVPPTMCFDWQSANSEPAQTPYCEQKLTWLLDHGYEVGNHTYDHTDLLDLSDDQFVAKVGGGWTGLQKLVPGIEPDILAMPFGNYPDKAKHPAQRTMMRDGFSYEGAAVKITAALMVGANPADSPVSVNWDPLYLARIRAYEGAYGSTRWLDQLASDPSQLYTSDGDPSTITVPTQLPPALAGTFDEAKATADGKRIIRYDAATGEAS